MNAHNLNAMLRTGSLICREREPSHKFVLLQSLSFFTNVTISRE